MRRRAVLQRKKLDYPDETPGSCLAAEIRKRANKLTAEQRRTHVNAAMAMVYGGARVTKTTGAGH